MHILDRAWNRFMLQRSFQSSHIQRYHRHHRHVDMYRIVQDSLGLALPACPFDSTLGMRGESSCSTRSPEASCHRFIPWAEESHAPWMILSSLIQIGNGTLLVAHGFRGCFLHFAPSHPNYVLLLCSRFWHDDQWCVHVNLRNPSPSQSYSILALRVGVRPRQKGKRLLVKRKNICFI